MPAPKSLVSNTAASEVAAVNSSSNTDARAILTALPKPIETAVTPVNTRSRTAQLTLTPGDQAMKAGETRRFAIQFKTDVPLALAVLSLRFDPKVVRVRAFAAGAVLASELLSNAVGLPAARFMQSVDPAGICLISISNANGAKSMQGEGTLLFVDVEAITAGDAGFAFDKAAMHLVSTDARDVVFEVAPVSTLKQ